ncbi:hypothetical protein M2352_003911 [Azospirillum fermentarium]|uniref:hypothetical protein n=1 Tax=Azospirillum fermentarium TaxID=1233114 RepID=UPI00222755CE|nr:hypothetical protein [Azospirillum fermentarium]MCW2248277.1 hypothetical protein [Azospirillum fermentarium]
MTQDADKNIKEGQSDASNVSTSFKSRIDEISRHPIVVAFFGFLCTGILGALLTWWLNASNHIEDIAISTRNNAISSASNLSELFNERRARGTLVISSIMRAAPESEVVARKIAYDEAYIRWNTKIPSDILRIRAGLRWSRSYYAKYIDGLTNANILFYGSEARTLLNAQKIPIKPGILSIMDACITQAFDDYRGKSFIDNTHAKEIISSCRFSEINRQSIHCFSLISESLYIAVSEKGMPGIQVSDEEVISSCKPYEFQ